MPHLIWYVKPQRLVFETEKNIFKEIQNLGDKSDIKFILGLNVISSNEEHCEYITFEKKILKNECSFINITSTLVQLKAKEIYLFVINLKTIKY